jgi:heme-degrading monooxygenase HmoA
MPVVITAFPEPGQITPPSDGCTGTRYRALDNDARFGLIEILTCPSDAAALARTRSVSGLTGRYEVFHTGGDLAPEAEHEITFINCLQVERGREDAAFSAWRRVNDYMVRKPGYISHVLHRRSHAEAAFGFVNVVRWASVEAWADAHDEGFRARTRPEELPFVPMPTLCRPVETPVTS